MNEAYKEALKAYNKNEVPIGCVVVVEGKIIARAHNLRNKKKNALYHAEIIAISRACKKLKRWILEDATLYVTVEPCIMCGGAIIQSRIKRLVYGTSQPRFGVAQSLMKLFDDYKFNNNLVVDSNIMSEEIKDLMQSFFKRLRHQKEII